MTRKIDIPTGKAEGDCCGVPYDTDLAGSSGVSIHFWLGARSADVVPHLVATAKSNRDVVRATYSEGDPTGYWAHSDMGKPLADADQPAPSPGR